jgi:hypothetical protein
LNLAALKIARGDAGAGLAALRDLELRPDATRETASAAMFLRALCFETSGDWPDAMALFSRICRLEPFSYAAAVSPLVIVRHYVERSDSIEINDVLNDARDYYMGAIARENGYMEHPHVLKDFFIETFMAAGQPGMAARLLEEHGASWRPANGSVALLKSAMIYMNLLDDRENGVRMLQKCLDLFPQSPYAWTVQKKINGISTSVDKPRTG